MQLEISQLTHCYKLFLLFIYWREERGLLSQGIPSCVGQRTLALDGGTWSSVLYEEENNKM